MSFRPQGVSVASSFANNGNGQGARRQYPKDRLCEVRGYSLGASFETSSMSVVDLKTGQQLDVSIDPKTIQRFMGQPAASTSREPAKWLGWRIDSKMQEHVPVGSWLVLERAVTLRNTSSKGPDGNPVTRSIVQANYVSKVSTPSATKAFNGTFTISTRDGRVNQVQSWTEKAFDSNDTEALAQFAERLDACKKQYDESQAVRAASPADKKVRTPVVSTAGVMFRALIPTGVDAQGQPTYQMINSTPPFSWISAVKDAQKNVIEPGRPIDRDRFNEILQGYYDYIDQTFPFDAKDPNADQTYKDLRIEVMPFEAYRASSAGNGMTIPESSSLPLHRLANTPTKYALEDTDYITEQNWAVAGILVLSRDAADEATRTWMVQNYAQNLYANGYMGNLHALVRSADNARVTPHPDLDKPKDWGVKNTATDAPSTPADGAEPGGSSGLVASASDPFAMDDGADPFAVGEGSADEFATALAQETPAPAAAAAPAPSASAPPRRNRGSL